MNPSLDKLAKVVLYGKPNVGKSSLFNLLTHKQDAIVADQPGLTRDSKYGLLFSADKTQKAILTDLAGISDNNLFFDQLTQKKVVAELKDTDLIVFVLELQVDKDDEKLLKNLRTLNKPIVLCVNKVDKEEEQYLENNKIYKMGIEQTLFVSCKSKINILKLKQTIFKTIQSTSILAKKIPFYREYDAAISLIGKPNVGKSSFLNKLLNKDRAIVSNEEGTTRDTVVDYFELKDKKVKVIDTAGIKRKRTKLNIVENFSLQKSIHAINQSDICILLIDAQEGISNQDKKISAIVKNKYKPLILIVNKWDLLTEKNWEKYKDKLLFLFSHAKNFHILPLSCKTGKNFKNILNHINKLINDLKVEFKTKELNDFVQTTTFKNPPPRKNKQFLKIYYAVQIASNPLVISFYVNNRDLVTANYQNYLLNAIREYKNIKGVSIVLKFIDKKTKKRSIKK